MQIKLREYQQQDFEALEAIIRETWHYDDFSSPKTAIQLAKVFLSSCLTNYTFSRVAVVDGTAAGIILVNQIAKHKCPLSNRLLQIKSILSLYSSKEGRDASKIFGSVKGIDQQLRNETKQRRPIRQNWPCLLSVLRAEEKGSEKCFFDPRWTICGKKN